MAEISSSLELRELVAAFEAGSLRLERWHHAEHLAVAVWYLERHRDDGVDVGLGRIREGIVRLNARLGIEQTRDAGYHESVTRFLALGIDAFLRGLPEALNLDARVDAVQRAFGDFRGDFLAHYSRDVASSWRARTEWVEPDLTSLSVWLERCRGRASKS